MQNQVSISNSYFASRSGANAPGLRMNAERD